MPLRPLSDHVIAKVTEAETTSRGGIVLPDTAKERPQRAQVVAVGPGKSDDNGKVTPLDVKQGDVIIYSRYGGTEVKIGGEELVILSERDILAVVGGQEEDAGEQKSAGKKSAKSSGTKTSKKEK